MILNRIQFSFCILIFSLLLTSTSCNSPTQAEDPLVLLRLKNLSGYDLVDINTRFFVSSYEIEQDFGAVPNGSETDYQEVPLEVLASNGHYCTWTNGYSEELGFILTMAILCPDFNPDRAQLITGGHYTLTLEYILSDIINLSLVTHSNDSSDVLIRIHNISDRDFVNVLATFPGDATVDPVEIDYGSVGSGNYSDFVSVELAYRYTHLIVTTEADTISWMPIDYVGETPLSPGKYSYELDIIEGQKDVSKISED